MGQTTERLELIFKALSNLQLEYEHKLLLVSTQFPHSHPENIIVFTPGFLYEWNKKNIMCQSVIFRGASKCFIFLPFYIILYPKLS